MFCDIGPTCYKIALQKEICKRHIKNFFAQESYADTQDTAPLPCIVAQYSSHLIKRGKGIQASAAGCATWQTRFTALCW